MITWTTLDQILLPSTKRSPLQQGWSPQCESHPAEKGAWGVLKTTAIQAGSFVENANKRLPEALKPRPELEVMSGDLLITCAGPRARCGVPTLVRQSRPRLLLSGKMYRFRAIPDVDPRFLEYYLLSPNAQAAIDSMKTGISESGLNLTKSRFLGLPVPVAPLAQQQRIVEILDDHLSRLDAGTDILATAEVRLGLVTEAITGVASELLSAPMRMLENVLAAPLSNGRSVPTAEEGFPVLRLTAMRDGVVDLNERKIGQWSAEDALSFRVAEGDVFAARGNGSLRLVGRAARVVEAPDPIAYPDTMIRMRPDANLVRADYLTAVWNSRIVRRQIETRARTTAGIYKVNQADLRGIVLPVPSLADQLMFVNRVESWSDAVRATLRTVQMAKRREVALRRSLLTAAFSGRLTGSTSDNDRVEEMAGA